MAVGDRVDSEMEIQEMYDVSRITARQAILELEQEGMVKRGRGKGTFVTYRPKIKEELSHIRSFTDEMTALGRKPGTKSFHITKESRIKPQENCLAWMKKLCIVFEEFVRRMMFYWYILCLIFL